MLLWPGAIKPAWRRAARADEKPLAAAAVDTRNYWRVALNICDAAGARCRRSMEDAVQQLCAGVLIDGS